MLGGPFDSSCCNGWVFMQSWRSGHPKLSRPSERFSQRWIPKLQLWHPPQNLRPQLHQEVHWRWGSLLPGMTLSWLHEPTPPANHLHRAPQAVKSVGLLKHDQTSDMTNAQGQKGAERKSPRFVFGGRRILHQKKLRNRPDFGGDFHGLFAGKRKPVH